MESLEYRRLMQERQTIIRQNAGRRIKGLPALPVPPKPEKPKVKEAYDAEGVYIGCWPGNTTDDDIRYEAEQLGETVAKIKIVDKF